ncbi:iron (metal) dependent repressor, DtxR family [Desulfonispora thiosulfatigenes DSM 11270]|uniref:Iron (Metal) dependent repressor, DtxR family n=1 Tax=Desulfonispora thiosulfatigenes DSM 11270 TaxID=656914 RepID=A0A1W1VTH3_DESTI|nr:metal-dependent transcriptional regulator [Desulfonispora thiosulfatigenes]SMB96573.1 iron (metal) dependent repressor, DtxR family [Desulfonispora thiosulfatigenes DSM 11270]
MSAALTHSVQDYLEVILQLSADNNSVRVTDIAKRLEIAKASVTQAINNMHALGLVHTEKYGPVSLTEKGRREAKKVKYKHIILKNFLVNVLKVEENIADNDACLMEHAISTESIVALLDFLKEKGFLDTEFDCKEVKVLLTTSCLSDLKPGGKGKIVKVEAQGSLRRRILEMGITTGDLILVKRIAPMGDPMEICIKDYNLSLRKNEANAILVEVV